jgi:hypothetical protein
MALTSTFGEHAGKVWQALQVNGELPAQRLLKATLLSEQELSAAVGWLARENKILQREDLYALGETNLIPTIGRNAGMLWRVMDIWGEVSLSSLVLLSREGKLEAVNDPAAKRPVFRLK